MFHVVLLLDATSVVAVINSYSFRNYRMNICSGINCSGKLSVLEW